MASAQFWIFMLKFEILAPRVSSPILYLTFKIESRCLDIKSGKVLHFLISWKWNMKFNIIAPSSWALGTHNSFFYFKDEFSILRALLLSPWMFSARSPNFRIWSWILKCERPPLEAGYDTKSTKEDFPLEDPK